MCLINEMKIKIHNPSLLTQTNQRIMSKEIEDLTQSSRKTRREKDQ